MSRRRLLFVLDSLEENDAGDHVATLVARIPRSRYEPRVVALGPQGALGSRIREMQVTVHRLELTGAVGALVAVSSLRRLLRAVQADVVHAVQPWSGAVAQRAAPRGVRVIRWQHQDPPPPRSLEERIRRWMQERTSPRRGAVILAADLATRKRLQARWRMDDIAVIPPCVDIAGVRERVLSVRSREARVHLGLSDGERAVVAFSDFLDRGRMAAMLEGFAAARTEYPLLRLFVYGGGPEEGAAKWLAEDLRLGDSVVFLGMATRREVLLRGAVVVVDAGITPGWWRGSMEAMALGLPVLCWLSRGEEPSYELHPAVTAAPPERFARDLLDLMEDEALRERVSLRATEIAQRYHVADIAERWAELYAG